MRFMGNATPASLPGDRASAVPIHAEPLQAVWDRTGSRPGGLTVDDLASRHRATSTRAEESRLEVILEELAESLTEPLMLLLLAVAVLSAVFGELRDAIVIFGVIVVIGA